MNNDTNSRAIAKVIIDLASCIAMFLADILSFEQLKYWQAHKNDMKKNLREAFKMPPDEFAGMRLDWQAFYKKRYNWEVDFSQVIILPRPSLAHRLLIIARGLTCDKVYLAWLFPKWKYVGEGSLDAVVMTNIRTSANGHYAIWVLDGAEPDAEFLGKTTEVADPEMKISMTFLERLLLEDKYFDETGKHLDVIGGTFCGGSRSAGGSVPYVDLRHVGRVGVGWLNPSYSNPRYGVRRAVST